METSIAISYHTESDAAWAEALTQALGREGVVAQKLDYLTLSGFSLPIGPAGGRLRKDGWIDHFADILAGTVGMIVIRSQSSRESETMPARGMWVEQQLATQIRGGLKDFVCVVRAPLQIPGEVGSIATSWASDQVRELSAWLERREHAGPPGLARFDSHTVNIRQPYFNHEIQYAGMTCTWFFISILDLYDRIWHCRNCLATSDVWLATEFRPPARCPACGYSGDHDA